LHPAREPVNGRAAGGIPLNVLISLRIPALVLGVGLISGCASTLPARGSGPLSGLAPGTTTLRVINNVSAPGSLDHVDVVVDGEQVPLSSVPPPGARPATIASLHLRPGPHTISVRATGHHPGDEVAVVGAQQPFYVSAAPAAILLDVRTGVPGSSAAPPIAVSLTILGGHTAPELGVAPPEDKDARCAGLLPIPRAICRASADLDEDNRKSDVVAALCARDKLAEMRKLAVIGESGKPENVALAEARVGFLARQVDRCAVLPPAAMAPDGVTVTRLGTR
jgi:hypothetical protein